MAVSLNVSQTISILGSVNVLHIFLLHVNALCMGTQQTRYYNNSGKILLA